MPDFAVHEMDSSVCRKQTDELRVFLQRHARLTEREIIPFFRRRPHLSALIGSYCGNTTRLDRLTWEYRLFGDLQCDLVVGDSLRSAFAFIEFESAGPTSLFVKHGAKATREWSSHFENGYSQIVDWFYKLQVMTNSPDMEDRFGKRAIDYSGVLIVGRNQFMTAGERMRLEWRREHVVVNSKKIVCVTYDQLLDDLRRRLEV